MDNVYIPTFEEYRAALDRIKTLNTLLKRISYFYVTCVFIMFGLLMWIVYEFHKSDIEKNIPCLKPVSQLDPDKRPELLEP